MGLAKNNEIQEFPRYGYIEIPTHMGRQLLQKHTNDGCISGYEKRDMEPGVVVH